MYDDEARLEDGDGPGRGDPFMIVKSPFVEFANLEDFRWNHVNRLINDKLCEMRDLESKVDKYLNLNPNRNTIEVNTTVLKN